jgi:hypothetical protein
MWVSSFISVDWLVVPVGDVSEDVSAVLAALMPLALVADIATKDAACVDQWLALLARAARAG